MGNQSLRPLVVTTRVGLRPHLAAARVAGKTIGLVPTMGALHAGHMSLVERSRRECDYTVATIFVNPTQFGPNEDFSRYPRTLDADLTLLANASVDLVFAPDTAEMYPAGNSTLVEVGQVSEPLEGQFRPGHFRGVSTIVLKLFQLIPADVAYFGQKDFQQSLVIRRMVEDLNLPIAIRVCPIVREPDGLAMSSRNRYLSLDERRRALALSQSLQVARELVRRGTQDPAVILRAMSNTIAAAGGIRVDYVTLVNPQTLEPVTKVDRPTAALVAAWVGITRLIDNELLTSEPVEGPLVD